MRTRTKAALTVLCALLLVVATFLGTLAYMTSKTAVVTNTFTAGNVAITLDEAPTDVYGVVIPSEARRTTNTLKLIPGHTYIKDPTIHVKKGSEECYVFVKVVNGLADLGIETETTIAAQLTTNKWELVEGQTDVYYLKNTVNALNAENDVDVPVFGTFTVANDADVSKGDGKTISVIGYAVQKDGFNTAKEAWDATAASFAAQA